MTRVLDILPENPQGKDFLVGDLHGYLDELLEKLNISGFDPSCDRLLAVGDLIDRGPDSLGCLELLKEPWFFSVQGNHERFLVASMAGDTDAQLIWLLNGGRWSKHYSEARLLEAAELIEDKMPLAFELGFKAQRLGIVHAEVPEDDWNILRSWQGPPDASLLEFTTCRRTRLRVGLQNPVSNIDQVFCGHSLVEQPLTLGNVHYLETGICASQLGGYLTLIEARDLLLP
ncbi:serine/threonine protein phosphatase 1 [Marinospirillum celere]|uniref:Serine/threonine protein phosphatase 1 n=1 Tax=Marinospirillum celere TaxID=1122252 RepID=A0A1I1E3W3_9GAMM|nr:metallophosphoesterase [Marinospirillum celere]SFB81767.1 serine/threonine protein phosphatase 1 [Marinospirillum celere]